MNSPSGFLVRSADWETDRPALQAIREEVFVREQSVPPELEWDEHDALSRHVLAVADGMAIGTGRLLPDGHIGRMAVLPGWRNRGVGSAMLKTLMAMAQGAGCRWVMLSAQKQAVPFYRRFGFEPGGDEYVEAGISHIAMSRQV